LPNDYLTSILHRDPMPESQDELVLADLKSIFEPLGLPIMLVGAGARILIFDQIYEQQGRLTEDLDIVTQIPDWLTFGVVTQAMTQSESALFQATKIPHRFQHIATGKTIDVVPFGPISDPDQLLRWQDGNQIMNVVGLQEALNHAITLDDVAIPVVSLPAFIVLKLLAWNDRREPKDQQDIDFILANYRDDDRVYAVLYEKLADAEIQILDASIYLLGKDIRAIFRPQTLAQLTPIFDALLKNADPDDLTDAEQRLITLRQSIESDT
jgi:predicted nucleotidyltransferase